jgi:hypothetical protein
MAGPTLSQATGLYLVTARRTLNGRLQVRSLRVPAKDQDTARQLAVQHLSIKDPTEWKIETSLLTRWVS